MKDGGETGYRDRIYSADWRARKDPDVPEYFNPTATLLDRHLDFDRSRTTVVDPDDRELRRADRSGEHQEADHLKRAGAKRRGSSQPACRPSAGGTSRSPASGEGER